MQDSDLFILNSEYMVADEQATQGAWGAFQKDLWALKSKSS